MTSENEATARHPEHLPPPIGLHHEQPRTTTEVLKQTIEEDPDYARWVLVRCEELMAQLDAWHQSGVNPRDTDIKEILAAILLEARELELALLTNKELEQLLALPTTEEE